MGSDDKIPYMVPIMKDNKAYKETVTAVRFSQDAVMAGVAFTLKDSTGQVFLYRMLDKLGHLVPEKNVRKPLKVVTIPDCKTMGTVIDIFLFKQHLNDEV